VIFPPPPAPPSRIVARYGPTKGAVGAALMFTAHHGVPRPRVGYEKGQQAGRRSGLEEVIGGAGGVARSSGARRRSVQLSRRVFRGICRRPNEQEAGGPCAGTSDDGKDAFSRPSDASRGTEASPPQRSCWIVARSRKPLKECASDGEGLSVQSPGITPVTSCLARGKGCQRSPRPEGVRDQPESPGDLCGKREVP